MSTLHCSNSCHDGIGFYNPEPSHFGGFVNDLRRRTSLADQSQTLKNALLTISGILTDNDKLRWFDVWSPLLPVMQLLCYVNTAANSWRLEFADNSRENV